MTDFSGDVLKQLTDGALLPAPRKEDVPKRDGGGAPQTSANAAGRVVVSKEKEAQRTLLLEQLQRIEDRKKQPYDPLNLLHVAPGQANPIEENLRSQLADIDAGREPSPSQQLENGWYWLNAKVDAGVEDIAKLGAGVIEGGYSVAKDTVTGDFAGAGETLSGAWDTTKGAAGALWNAVVHEPWFEETRTLWNAGAYGPAIGGLAPDLAGVGGLAKSLAAKLGSLVKLGKLTAKEAKALAEGTASKELIDKAKAYDVTDRELAAGKKASEPVKKADDGDLVKRGEPVVVTRGEYVETWDDFYIDGTLPIHATRYYGAQMAYTGPLGRNRISPFDVVFRVTADNDLEYASESGARLFFARPFGLGSSRNAGFPHLELTAPKLRHLVLRDRRVEKFFRQYRDGLYRLERIEDLNGNRVEFRRDRAGLLLEATHSDGFALAFTNDADGRRAAVEWRVAGGSRRLVEYAYDAHGNMLRAECSGSFTISYAYDARGRLESWRDASGRSGSRFIYDDADRVVRTETTGPWHNDVFEYDRAARKTVYRPGGGDAAETFFYDADENVTREIDPLGHERHYEYNEAGFRLAETDALGNRKVWAYDGDGNVKSYEDGAGRWAHYAWNPWGDVDVAIDGAGNGWSYDYDANGNLIAATDPLGAETRYEWSEAGRLVRTLYADGGIERREYDAHHRLSAIVAVNGGRSVYARDAFGRVLSVTDAAGAETRFVYDESRGKDFYAPTQVMRPDGVTITRRFDAEGQVAEVTDGEGRRWRYGYGPFDLPVRLEEPGGGVLQFEYDILKRLIAVTDAKGRRWVFRRDAAGRVSEETDFAGLRFRYAYDAAGRVTERHHTDGSRIAYAYDKAGLLIREEAFGAEGKLQERTRFFYDARGLLERAENGSAVIQLTRDAVGRVTHETVNGRAVKSGYDALGRRASRVLGGQLVTYDHDPLGVTQRLIIGGHAPLTRSFDVQGRERSRVSGAGFRQEQQYDALGQLLRQSAGFDLANLGKGLEGARAAQALNLDPQRAASQASRTYSWNKAFEPVNINDQRWGATDYAYDANGQVEQTRFGDGTAERFAYDKARGTIGFGEGVGPKGPTSGTTLIDKGVFAHWQVDHGRVTQARGPNNERIRLHYDSCGRVVERTVERDGFRLKRWRYEWDAKDRMIACLTPEQQRWTYHYDPFGRRIFKIDATGAKIAAKAAGMRFAEDELRGAFYEERPTPPQYQARNGKPARIGTAYQWDGHTLAEEAPLLLDGTIDWENATRWHYEENSFRPLAKETPDGKLLYIVTDHLGTPRELFSEDGKLQWAAEYRTWGSVRRIWRVDPDNDNLPVKETPGTFSIRTGIVSVRYGNLALKDDPNWQEAELLCPIRFQGQWQDAETGLYYNWFRHYDPLAGQYVSPDPIGLHGGTRPHGYVHNPNGWVDPLGLAPKKTNTGTTKGGAKGEPNSRYVQLHETMKDKAIQTTIYDSEGRAIGHVDWQAQHGVASGHGHGFETPGDFSSGHGGRGTFYPPNSLPSGWGELPPGISPIGD